MLSRHPCGLHVGYHSPSPAAPHHLLAVPPHPQLRPGGTPPVLCHSLGVLSPPRTPDCLHRTTHPLSEHVGSGPSSYFCQQSSKEVARRRMMPSPFSSTAPIPAQCMHFTFPLIGTKTTTFAFPESPPPEMALTFSPRPAPPRPRKRCRAVADVDGENSCLHKKKRRLRLFLITSRLSPQFSHPATNIVDRGSSKIAVWAKQRAIGRNLLRKAAILNRIRWKAITAREAAEGLGRVLVEQEKEQEELKLAKLAFLYGSHDTYTRPVLARGPMSLSNAVAATEDSFELAAPPPISVTAPSSPPLGGRSDDDTSGYSSPNAAYSYSPPRSESPRRAHLPLPPSPLGLSNYDAFDVEDDIPDPYSHLDDDYDAYDQDEDMRSPSPAAPTSRPSTVRRDSFEASKTPPQPVYSDFSILSPDEPVVGDYDQIDDGGDALWPSAFASELEEPTPSHPLSSSPDFPALFAPAQAVSVSVSPNFAPPPQDAHLSPTSSSPNFPPLSSLANQSKALSRGEPGEADQEREKKRRFMYMQYGT